MVQTKSAGEVGVVVKGSILGASGQGRRGHRNATRWKTWRRDGHLVENAPRSDGVDGLMQLRVA